MSIANLTADSTLNVKEIYFGNEGTSLDSAVNAGYTSTIGGAIPGTPQVDGLIRVIGKTAILSINGISAMTTVAGGFIVLLNPVSPRPYNRVVAPIWVINANTHFMGSCTIDTNGSIVISRDYASSFSGSQVCGYETFTICYSIYD